MNLFNSKTDQPKKVHQIMDEQLKMSLHEFSRSNLGLFLSAFAAGLEIGFSVLFIGTIYSMFGGQLSPEAMHLVLGLCYPLGFIFVIIGRSELFTEHTALAVLPVLDRSVTISDLLQLWGIVYLGNILGGYIFGGFLVYLGSRIGFITDEAFYFMAHELIQYDGLSIFLSALLAGWMMGLLGWLVTSAQDTVSRILLVIFVTAIIGITGLHHCIVGSIEVFSGLLTSSDITWANYGHFQLWTTLGNVVGGAVFVSLLKFSHVRLN